MAFRFAQAYLSTGFPTATSLPRYFDSELTYKPQAINLLAGHGLSLDPKPPYRASILRGPAYPLFLAGIYRITSFSDWAVILLQILMSAGGCLLFYGLAREFFAEHPDRDILALGAFFLLVFNPLASAQASYILTESLSQLLFLIALYSMIRALKAGRTSQAVASGVFAGLAILNQPVNLVSMTILGLWLIGLILKGHTTPRLFIGFALGVFILWSPWVARNYFHYDRFIPLTVLGGSNLYFNVMHLEDNRERVRECIGATDVRKNLLMLDGQSGLEDSARCYRIAWQAIRDHPWGFALKVFKKPFQMWLTSYPKVFSFRIEDHLAQYQSLWDQNLVSQIANGHGVSRVYIWFHVYSNLFMLSLRMFFLLTGLAGALRAFQSGLTRVQWIVLLTLVGHTGAFAFLSRPASRYMTPIWPYLVLFSAFGLLSVWRAVAQKEKSGE